MTSEERREIRYQRRKKRRQEKRKKYESEQHFSEVFSYKNLYKSYLKCRRGVAWKSSTQKYISQAPLNVYRTYEQLKKGTYKSKGFYEFDLYERGKKRHIRSVTIDERVVQKCLCDNSLVPAVTRSFIYDNGASMEGKGYHFAIRRIVGHLRRHYRKHGTKGYVLLFDFSKFFDNVSHKIVQDVLNNKFEDEKLLKIQMHFVNAFGDCGMGLGSQISQTLALASADKLDHAIKENMRIQGYGRYMDDGYLIHESKEYLQQCLAEIKKICDELEITLNFKKTQIVKLTHGFTWLKCRFYLLESGKVVKKIYKRSVTKERQKIKKLHKLYKLGRLELSSIHDCVQSWISYALQFDATKTVVNLIRQLIALFGVQDTKKLVRTKKLRHNSIRQKMRYIQYLTHHLDMIGV